MQRKHGKTKWKLGLVTVLLALSACTSVQLVSNYDDVIDRETLALQKKLDAYFIALKSTDAEQRRYRNQRKFYESVVVDLNSLQVRAQGIYRNGKTVEQFDLVEENLAYLLLLHKGCVTAPLTDEQKRKVRDNGVDLSLDCKREFGATADVAGRGEQALSPLLVSPLQAQFNQQLGAIMALEMAKKRGDAE